MKSGQRVFHRAGWLVKTFAGSVLVALALLATGLRAQDADNSANLSPAAAQVLQMAESSISDDVLLSYIQNSTTPFDLTADDITYLRDMGLTSQVIDAMMNRDKALLQQPPAAPAQTYILPTVPPAAEATTPAYVGDAPDDVNYFYSDLSPYGSWVDLQGYGWCWQPTAVVVNTGWRPYCDGGHWVYTDAGWFWDSDYSWGWAPFHYGRWVHHDRVGWVWFPDRVWGPAWVTWRVAGNNCGWAPLPLHATFDPAGAFLFNGVRVGVNFNFGLSANLFTFVGVGDIGDRDWRRHRLHDDEVGRIYNQTTIINNYTVSRGNVINHGIPVDRVTAVTHTPIRPVPIREAASGPARHEERSGATVAVFKRDVRPPSRPVVVQAQQVDERHPKVQHVMPQPSATRRITTTPAPSSAARPVDLPPARRDDTPGRAVPTKAPALTAPPAPARQPLMHGRSVIPAPVTAPKPTPQSFEAKPEEMQIPNRTTTPAPAKGIFDYEPRSKTATKAHALPPEVPQPVNPAPVPPTPPQSTVTHSYTPRIQQATTGHALAPEPGPAPKRSIFSSPPPGSSPTPAPATPPPRVAPRTVAPAPAPAPPSAPSAPSTDSGQGNRGRGRGDR